MSQVSFDSSVSQQKIDANRANAQSSTGPRTDAGKYASRLNSFKHGMFARCLLVPGDDPIEMHRHKIGLIKSLNPEDTLQQVIAERIICASWKLKRMEQAEQELYRAEMNDPENPAANPGAAMVRLMKQGKPGMMSEIERIQKYQQKLEGTMNRNFTMLQKIQKERYGIVGILNQLTGELIEDEERELVKLDPEYRPRVLGLDWRQDERPLKVDGRDLRPRVEQNALPQADAPVDQQVEEQVPATSEAPNNVAKLHVSARDEQKCRNEATENGPDERSGRLEPDSSRLAVAV